MNDGPISTSKLLNHPLAGIFPMMSQAAHKELAADIKARGLQQPIVLYEKMILDGRNRQAACDATGVQPTYVELPEGVDPLQFVVSTNYVRRHLSESQRSIAAARIQEYEVSREDASKRFKLPMGTIKKAEAVLQSGVPALVKAVEDDKIPVAVAAKLVVMPEEAQIEAVGLAVKDLRGLIKKQARIRKNVSLIKATARATKALGDQLYPVILCDPPWLWEPFSDAGKDRSAENHYPVMALDEVKNFPLPAAPNCVVFLWVPPSMLEQGMEVLKHWGLTYKSQFVWVKNKAGTGYWNRASHELLLVATRGNIPAPEPSERIDSVIHADVGEHSVKPAIIMDAIQRWYPNFPKVELFAREHREGWASHGNELPEAKDEAQQAAD